MLGTHTSWLRADENGGSPALPQAVEAGLAMHQLLAEVPELWREQLHRLRSTCAQLLGCDLGAVWFAPTGSHANALAIFAYAAAHPGRLWLHSGLEHPATMAVLGQAAQRFGIQLLALPCQANGQVCLEALEVALKSGPGAVVALWASNETGVIQPVQDMVILCRQAGVPLLCDGVQAIGRLAWPPKPWLWPSAVSCVGHKLGGLGGCGLLRLERPWLEQSPWPFGDQGALRDPWSALEVNLPAAAALCTALQHAVANQSPWAAIAKHKLVFEQKLVQQVAGVTVIGQDSPRLPQTSTLHIAGCANDALLMVLDIHEGIACSAGSACRSGVIEPSPSLLHMQWSRQAAQQVVRFSFGRDEATCQQQMEQLLAALIRWIPVCRQGHPMVDKGSM